MSALLKVWLFVLAGAGIGGYISWLWLTFGNIQHRHPLLMFAMLLIIVGIQLICMGLIGEMIANVASSRETRHVVREILR